MKDSCAIGVAIGQQVCIRRREQKRIQKRAGIGIGAGVIARRMIDVVVLERAIGEGSSAWRGRGTLGWTCKGMVKVVAAVVSVALVTKALSGWAVWRLRALFAKTEVSAIKDE